MCFLLSGVFRVPKDTYYDTQQEAADLDQEKAAKEKPGLGMCTHQVYACTHSHVHALLHLSSVHH